MNVFISWSGDRSRAVADALQEFIPTILQRVHVQTSVHDVRAGAEWALQLSHTVSESDVGIACVTSDNIASHWLTFEAGVLGSRAGMYVSVLADVSPVDLDGPLAAFQAMTLSRADMMALLRMLNRRSPVPVGEDTMLHVFNVVWPDFERRVRDLSPLAPAQTATRSAILPGAGQPNRAHSQEILEHLKTAVARLRLELDLRRGIEREELELVYQPLVSLTDGRINGFEALTRWRHPERGLLQPADFIPLAEETGLIVPLGRWVLREACGQAREWSRRFGSSLSMHVNVSVRQLGDTALVSDVAAVLRESGLPPASLKLEIAESNLTGDRGESTALTLNQLKTLGVGLCIDDFGTGYSSLSYLHRFPIDTLKIDRSFIARLGNDGQSDQIVRTIVVLAQTLNLRAVAEGVETPDQADRLRGMGCEYAQGFRFSHPVAGDAAGAMIWRQRLSA